jgi:glycosyltransferase involved in cell wall biosynthesis
MTGTFGMRPKGTMSVRAAGIAEALQQRGWTAKIVTVPHDYPADAGVETTVDGVPVVNTRTVSLKLWPLAVRQILDEARKFQPDLVHLFKPKGFGDLAARYLKKQGIPVIVDMDDWEGDGGWNEVLPYSRLQRALFNWQEHSWPSQANGLTVASRTLEQYAGELGAPADTMLYLPNQLTPQRFAILRNPPEPSRDYHLSSDPGRIRILLYTRFVEFEPAFLIEVMKLLARAMPEITLVIAGASRDGVAERELSVLSRRAGIAANLTSLGWVDPDDLGWIAQRCSAAIVPFDDSLLNRAKCSIKLLELIAAGIPVVASNVGENREYLTRHRAGLLARPGDPENHAEKLLDILNSDKWIVRSSTARTQDFTWQQHIAALESLYQPFLRRT